MRALCNNAGIREQTRPRDTLLLPLTSCSLLLTSRFWQVDNQPPGGTRHCPDRARGPGVFEI